MPAPTLERIDFMPEAKKALASKQRPSGSLYNITIGYLTMEGQAERYLASEQERVKEQGYFSLIWKCEATLHKDT